MTGIPDTSMTVLGRGSEATVYLDREADRAVKHFDRAPIAIARDKARQEFNSLQKAHRLTGTSDHVAVPAPCSLNEEHAMFSMEIVTGASLLTMLLDGSLSRERSRKLATVTAEGFVLFEDIISDFTLDHLFPSDGDRLTFVDFGNGAEGAAGLTPAGPHATFIEAAGATLYECTRPGRLANIGGLNRCAEFLAHLAVALGLTWSREFEQAVYARYRDRGGEGSTARRWWYTVAGMWTRKTLFAGIKELLKAESTPIREVISFVWDFPERQGALTNGIHKVVDGMMSAMARHGVSVTVLALGSESGAHVRNGYRIEHLAKGRLLPLGAIRKRIERAGPHTVTLFHGTFNPRYTLLGRVLHRHGLPYMVFPHTLMDQGFFSVGRSKKQLYWKLFERAFIDRAACIGSYDLGQRENLASRGANAPMIQTWNGICDPVIPNTDHFSTDGPVRFHFFGRMAMGTKGLDMLLDATAIVYAEEDIEVTLQGPGTEDLKELRDRVQTLGLTKIVHFEPPASTPNPIVIMAGYDVSILSSRYEGFPTALVEAMMAARPIVSTRVGTLAPVLEREGIAEVVDTTSEAIAEGMLSVIRARKSWPETGRTGREWAMSHLQWDPIVEQLLADLNECLGQQS